MAAAAATETTSAEERCSRQTRGRWFVPIFIPGSSSGQVFRLFSSSSSSSWVQRPDGLGNYMPMTTRLCPVPFCNLPTRYRSFSFLFRNSLNLLYRRWSGFYLSSDRFVRNWLKLTRLGVFSNFFAGNCFNLVMIWLTIAADTCCTTFFTLNHPY